MQKFQVSLEEQIDSYITHSITKWVKGQDRSGKVQEGSEKWHQIVDQANTIYFETIDNFGLESRWINEDKDAEGGTTDTEEGNKIYWEIENTLMDLMDSNFEFCK